MCSTGSAWALPQAGCPIRRSPDQRLLAATRGLSQQRYVLHRPLVPRHPPCALSSLTFLSSLDNERSIRTPRDRNRGARRDTRDIARLVKMRRHARGSSTASRRHILMGRFGVTAAPDGAEENSRTRRDDVAGGDGQARTADPLLAKQVLSQLSYIPEGPDVGLSGFEPETSRLSAVRSHQLS
jgi:hypothetical protein